MQKGISKEYLDKIKNSTSLISKSKIEVDGIEYLGNVIKTAPKISHTNLTYFGGFPAKTLSFEIFNYNNDLDFTNKEITVYRGIVLDNSIEYVKLGVFIPQAQDITNDISSRTIKFSNVMDKTQYLDDQYVSELDWSEGKTHSGLEIIQEICERKKIKLAIEDFPFYDYQFKQPNIPSNASNRDVISNYAAIGGCIAIFDTDGNLLIKGRTKIDLTFNRSLYRKVSREKAITFNTVVLGSANYTDDICYPEKLEEERVEYKLNDNYFVDLYRREMIEEVSKYIIGQTVIPYSINDMVDGFILELNDVVNVIDKNGEIFEAIVLSVASQSRIKSNFGLNLEENLGTNYNIAGSTKKNINRLFLQVNHIEGNISSAVEKSNDAVKKATEALQTAEGFKTSIENTEKQIKSLQDSIEVYSVDLDVENIMIPVDATTFPLETKDYIVNFYTYCKGVQVKSSVTTSSTCDGITSAINEDNITFSVDSSKQIRNLTNEFIVNFLYKITDEEIYTLSKKIVLTLVSQGKDGAQGIPGKDGEPGTPGAPGKDGQSTYFYVRYSENENGNPMTEAPNELTQYMGVANTTSPTPPSSYNAYIWSKIKGDDGKQGEQGIPGQPGISGQNSYFHVMYSEDGSTFTPEDGDYPLGKKPSAYIGTYTDFVEADSTDFNDYEWYKFTDDIDDELTKMKDQINNNSTAIENNQQKMLDELGNYVNQSTLIEVTNRLEKVENDSQLSLEFINNVSLNGIDQVTTKTGYTFNQDGLNIDKSTSKTKNTLDENGMTITDKTGSENSELFFAGYDEDLGESIVRTKNITVSKYLTIGTHMRIEDYQADGEQAGTGFFYVG